MPVQRRKDALAMLPTAEATNLCWSQVLCSFFRPRSFRASFGRAAGLQKQQLELGNADVQVTSAGTEPVTDRQGICYNHLFGTDAGGCQAP